MPTTLTPTLGKECFFGIASQGSAAIAGAYTAMSGGVLLPLTASEGVEFNPNLESFRMADYQDYLLEQLVRSRGEWWEGDVEVALIPGATAELLECIQTRASYNQQYFCSLYFHMPHAQRRVWDAKVTRARFRWTKSDIVRCTLSIVGMDGDTGTQDMTGSWPADALPFQWKETAVQLETLGGGLKSDVNIEEIDVTIDNFVHEPADGQRIGTTGKIVRLYNLAGIGCSGTFRRDFVDAGVWADFMNGTAADMTLTLSRGANTRVFTIRNMRYDRLSAPIPGDNASRVATDTPFTAHSADGVTAPITLS